MTISHPIEIFDPSEGNGANRPCVIAQLGQSLDGRIATLSGESRGISGAAALDHLHRLRAAADAVIVGVGTVQADDPSLTVRRVAGKSPLRVVIDPCGRMSRDSRCLNDGNAGCLVISSVESAARPGADILRLPAPNGLIAPRAIIMALAARGHFRLLVEGGARTLSRFMDADCIDRLHLMVSPILIGSGRTGLDLQPDGALARALRPKVAMHELGGGDILFVCDIASARLARDPAIQADFIYKITPAALWQRAEETGRFTGAPVDVTDGFIHFSSAAQVAATAAKHFAGQTDLLLVSVDAAQLGPALKWEVSRGGAFFPHLYGDLPLAAVVKILPMRPRADGQFDFEGLLP